MRLEKSLDQYYVLQIAGTVSIRLSYLITFLILSVIMIGGSLLSLQIGEITLSGRDIWQMISGQHDLSDSQVFALETRLPRIILGFLCGGAVAMSGAILQSLVRNPLADPGLFGFSQGSMVVIMLLIVWIPDFPGYLLPAAALLGGCLVALFILWFSGGRQGNMLALLLIGIATETCLSSINAVLILYAPDHLSYAISRWMAGSLFGADWQAILYFLPWMGASLFLALWLGPKLRIYELGEELAMALGESVPTSRRLILLSAVLMSSAAVTAIGPLMFLGIIGPNLARFLTAANGRAFLVLSAMIGGILVIGADMLTRSLSADIALPVGLSLILIGVPIFILVCRLRHLRYDG